MACEVKFECNVCGEVFIINGSLKYSNGQARVPLGWGAIRPTLRVRYPKYPDKKKDQEKYDEFEETCKNLKTLLFEKEYHVCHKCLKLSQDKILKIEQKGVR